MNFEIKYKKSNSWFWKKKKVIGLNSIKDLDRMVLFFPDGSIEEIAEWSKHDCRLGLDWVNFQKKQMEKESGQTIPTTV